MKILITGASGFIGKALCTQMQLAGHEVVKVIHTNNDKERESEKLVIADFSAEIDLQNVLKNVDVVIHTAARVHVMKDEEKYPLDAYMQTNTKGTIQLAEQAIQAGVKRFVFLSTIGVNGGNNTQPFKEDDIPSPRDDYSISKYKAEKGLIEVSSRSEMSFVIIRPPLVYGPGVKANFLTLMNWAKKGIPLPLGGIKNSRSLVSLENLTSFIMHCATHSKAENEIFLISDGEDVSTSDLLKRVANAFGKKILLFPMPSKLIEYIGLPRHEVKVARIFGSLRVDNSKARNVLGWRPVISMNDQLKKIAEIKQQDNEKTI